MSNNITIEKTWEYLNKIAPYLTENELLVLSQLFQLMEHNYTPVQKFGDTQLKFVMQKEENPYIDPSVPNLTVPDNSTMQIKQMLNSFNQARSHFAHNELSCIYNIINLINEHQSTIDLNIDENETTLTVVQNKELKYK